MNFCFLTLGQGVPETDFNTLHDVFDGVMEEADLDGEPSFDKLFSQMKLMKGGLLFRKMVQFVCFWMKCEALV